MKGCLVALLATVGVLLLFPGLCFLMFGDLVKADYYGGVILSAAGALIGAAIIINIVLKGE
jgi:hypothetical protein